MRHNRSDTKPSVPDRPCAACGGMRKRRIFRQAFSGITAESLIEGYDVVACRDCGFAFADGIPPQKDFDRHYKERSKYEYAERSAEEGGYDLSRFRSLAEEVSAFLPKKSSRILDIGCSTGTLLGLFRKKGYRSVHGMDPSPVCANSAKEQYGVKVYTGPISEIGTVLGKKAKFDCIILSGVLEHIRDLSHTLDAIARLLPSGGLLVVEVPDATRFARYPDAPFQQFSTEHINFFSPDSLGNLLSAHGFRKAACRRRNRLQAFSAILPSLVAVFYKSLSTAPRLRHETASERELRDYVRISGKIEARVRRVISGLAKRGTPVAVWGVGTHTQHLFAAGGLRAVKISAFVDSNPHSQGKKLGGYSVHSPSWLYSRTEPILISSRVFQHSIEMQIRKEMGLKNRIIKLYSL